MTGRTCIVTGASAGIGKATAKGLAALGATVVMTARDPVRGAAAREEVSAAAPAGEVHLIELDLASLASVRGFVAAFGERFDRLDVLIANAAVIPAQRQLTEDGFEMQLGVNHLGHFALVTGLLPLLERSAPARVVVLTSAIHRAGRIAWDDLRSDRGYRMMKAYAQSKLANLLFARELARRAEGVTANALHPGSAATDIMRESSRLGRWLTRRLGKSPDEGARAAIRLAAAPELAGVTGRYFEGMRERPPGRPALDDAAARRLWEVSAELTAESAARD